MTQTSTKTILERPIAHGRQPTRPLSKVFGALAVAVAVGSTSVGSMGCRGDDRSFDCESQATNFRKAVDLEQQPLRTIPASAPYPVAIDISEDGLNRLVESVVAENVPFAGTVPFGILPQGPADATVQAESIPVIDFDEVPGCENCVIFVLTFGVQLDSQGEPLSSGIGSARVSIPIYLRGDENSGGSVLVADYSQAEIEDWYLSVFGFDSTTHTTLSGALQVLVEEEIQTGFGQVELLRLDPWQIGGNEVRMVARQAIVDPEREKLTLAMHTNLPLPTDVGVDLDEPLPEDVAIVARFASGVLLAASHQLFAEGEIPRTYDDEGQPDPNGAFGVTLESIDGNASDSDPLAQKQVDTRFRVWRIAEGHCGFATADMPIRLRVNEFMTNVDVQAGAAVLVRGQNEGIGAAAEQEEQLVAENQHLIDVFREELAGGVGEMLNYRGLDVDGSTLAFITLGLDVEPDEIRTLMDFVVFADE